MSPPPREPLAPYERGRMLFELDMADRIPFKSVGGLNKRTAPERPWFVMHFDWDEFLRGYEARAAEALGPDWRTHPLSWSFGSEPPDGKP